MWPPLTPELLKRFPADDSHRAGEPASVLDPDCGTEKDGWNKCFASLAEIRKLPDDWDGQGTEAPSADVVDSATVLAVMIRQQGIRPPTTTVQGVAGDVYFEWQWPDRTTVILEVTAPYEGAVQFHGADQTFEYLPLRQLIAA